MLNIIDTHCHLDLAVFAADRQQVLQRSRRAGVTGFVIPAVQRDGWDALLELCAVEADCHAALGLHPVFLSAHENRHLDELDGYLHRRRPLAVGEIGLDFYLAQLDRTAQMSLFEAQLALAERHRLPVILHVRKAHEQALGLLRRFVLPGGIAHAFNGSLQQAGRYLDMGFKLGFGGMLSYERSSKLRALAQALPDSALVLETDAPDMSGAVCQGRRNSPEYLPEYLRVLARLRASEDADMARITSDNARQVLRLGGWSNAG